MSEDEKQDSQKTVVAFIAGLLIGGLLVWVFSSPSGADAPTSEVEKTPTSEATSETENSNSSSETETGNETQTGTTNEPAPVAELPVGDGSVTVSNQTSGSKVVLERATFPSDEGWVGVRDYVDGQLTGLLGVARYSKEQGLVPEEVILQRSTVAGNTYAIVFYSESGDRQFNLAEDVQVGGVMDTFTAQ